MAHRQPLADLIFIADFAAFCRTKGDETFRYFNMRGCALCQFLRASGRAAQPAAGGTYWSDGSGPDVDLPEGVSTAIWGADERFDLLADRLEALIADAPVVERVS